MPVAWKTMKNGSVSATRCWTTSLLIKFWFSTGTSKGEHLSLASLQNIHHQLNHLLDKSGRSVDIKNDAALKNSIESYKDATILFTMGGQKKVAPSNYNTGIGIYDV